MLGQASQQRPVHQGHSSYSKLHRGTNTTLRWRPTLTKFWTVECFGARVCKISLSSALASHTSSQRHMRLKALKQQSTGGGLWLLFPISPRGSVIHMYIYLHKGFLFLIDVEILSNGRKNFFPSISWLTCVKQVTRGNHEGYQSG